METLSSTIPVPTTVLVAFVFLIFASFFRRISLSGKKNWDTAWKPVEPSLKASPAPSATVTRGCIGIVAWGFGWLMFAGLLFLAFDFAFTGGQLSAALLANLTGVLSR